MDRRNFLKFLLASPLASPLFPALPSAEAGSTLFLIGNDPQDHLPAILAALERRRLVQGKRFAFREPYPFAAELGAALTRAGWEYADGKPPGSLTLAFQALRQPVPPSFTLVRNGRIMDLRTRELGRFWREMNDSSSLSTGLTIASLREPAPLRSTGWGATVFIDGDRRETLSLKKNRLRRYRTLHGEVLVRIEGGRAEVLASSCRHKICQSSAPAFLAGERIVCAPNHFLLTIDGPRFVDTVTG
jgi:hypothetical protein